MCVTGAPRGQKRVLDLQELGLEHWELLAEVLGIQPALNHWAITLAPWLNYFNVCSLRIETWAELIAFILLPVGYLLLVRHRSRAEAACVQAAFNFPAC